MFSRSLLVSLFIFITGIDVSAQSKYQKDFEEFINGISENYAYLKHQKIDMPKVAAIYRPQASKVENREEFIRLLENILIELHNGHSSLNTNLMSSNRLVPTGMDLFVEKIKGKYIITDVRKNSAAEKCDLKAGMEIIEFNSRPIDEQLQRFLPKYTSSYNSAMYQFALDMLFAGTHDTPREITINMKGVTRLYKPDNCKVAENNSLLESKKLNSHTGYIKINNSLGDNDLIPAFDNALDSFFNCKNIVIDLTETPSGGNTTVARSIMGRFISSKLPYQQHEVDESAYNTKRYWVEYVISRGKTYKGNVYLLVGHWTGSMGEGIAIGFDGMKRATVIGTKMAGLLGAIDGFTLKETNIRYQIPTERLYHINGTPREKFIPKILTRNSAETFQRLQKSLPL